MKKGKGKIFVQGYETVQKASVVSFAFLVLFPIFAVTIFSQVSPPATIVAPKVIIAKPGATPPVREPRPMTLPRRRRADNESPTPAEKSIRTDAKVNIRLCVSAGNVRINGWSRDEIRAYVNGGSKVGFTVLKKNEQAPIWIKVLGFDPAVDKEVGLDECLSGNEIQLDVPRGAVINLQGRETQIMVESVAKVKIENVGGDVSLNNIANGIEAVTYEGDVMVEKSSGPISLSTTTGNIVAFEVQSNEVSEGFKAKTRSGMVSLQSVEHAQAEVGSTSGSIKFAGGFSSGGQYVFNTTSGSILLAIPADTSCRVNATYSSGAFQSELQLKDEQKTPSVRVQKLTGLLGAGDCNLNLTTFNGAINIRKFK